jgi:cytochrome P450
VDPEVPGAFIAADYYEQLARLRRDAPVRRYAAGAWTVARYDDVRDISRDPARFVSGRGVLVNDPLRSGGTVEGSILHMDPPEHGSWRRLTSRRFTPNAVSALEPRVRDIARHAIGAACREGTCDFVTEVAAPFPVLVIAELLGIDHAHHDDFRRWSDAAIETPDHPDERIDDLVELHRFLIEHVRRRRLDPGDDIASVVATAEIDGRAVTTREAVTYLLSLLVAGNETTRHLVSGTVLALWEHPEQREHLARQPALPAGAVEECLRWVTPIQAFGRTAAETVVIGEEEIAAGDFVVMLYASANRDEHAFGPRACCFDVTRAFDTQHVAFGFGEHLCLGAALARLEARVLLEELLDACPEYDIVAPPEWIASTLVRGMSRLPVRMAS